MKQAETKTRINATKDLDLKHLLKSSPNWLLLVVGIVVGALIGFVLSFVKTPIYEASASVTTNLQLNKGGSVTEFMLDSQINHIGELYFNPNVVDLLLKKQADQGMSLDLAWLKAHAAVERRMLTSTIKVRDNDPAVAARIASDWAEILYQTLESAYPNAVEVSTAKNTLTLLENCAKPPEHFEGETFCKSMTKSDYDQAMEQAKDVLAELGTKTLGLSEYLSVSQFQPASIPVKPQSYHRGSMSLAGGAIGFLLVIGCFLIRKQYD